jgi:hypothetical protein
MDIKVTRGPVKAAGKEAVAAIAKVHSDGGLKLSPLHSKVMAKAYGVYTRIPHPGQRGVPGAFNSRIDVNPKGNHPVMTTLHEIGHKIDFEAVHPNAAAFSERAKVIAALKAAPRFHALQNEPQLRYSYKLYALTDEELFARAYAQYITTRSGSAQAMQELTHTLSQPVGALTQWPDAEFAPVLPLFDSLFTALGWAKP